MFAYGVRVMDENENSGAAAEILNDVWNDAQYARATGREGDRTAQLPYGECNRVIEAQLSGRPSPGCACDHRTPIMSSLVFAVNSTMLTATEADEGEAGGEGEVG